MGIVTKDSQDGIKVYKNYYKTTKDLQFIHKDITIEVPKGFKFDGVTLKSPAGILFNSEDLINGITPACFHDYICQYKKDYGRNFSTSLLLKLWKLKGINPIKATIVYLFVETYQIISNNKEWKQ